MCNRQKMHLCHRRCAPDWYNMKFEAPYVHDRMDKIWKAAEGGDGFALLIKEKMVMYLFSQIPGPEHIDFLKELIKQWEDDKTVEEET